MSSSCIDPHRIADVDLLLEDDPVRRHVAQCPRCRCLWLSYQSFMQADVSDATHIDAARAALEHTIRRKAGSAGATAPRAERMHRSPSWAAWLRPALVTAMAAVLTVLAISLWRTDEPEQPVLRGGDAAWMLHAPQLSSDQLVFQWEEMTGADAYEVQLFDDALNEVYLSDAVAALEVTIDRGALPGVADGASLTWRVRALRAGDVIATSPPSSLTLP